MKLNLLCLVSLLLAFPVVSQKTRTDEKAKIGPEEYAVYAAVVTQFSANGLIDRPMISDRTSTFQCGRSCNGMLVGKCSGMRAEDESAKQALERLSKQAAELKKETTEDFEGKNQECAQIKELLPLDVPYYMFSQSTAEDSPKAWRHPDYLYFSRVGFDPQGTQALVYLALMSGTDGKRSGGTYVLAAKEGTAWKVQKVVRVWSLGG